jgi:hypothetical protein
MAMGGLLHARLAARAVAAALLLTSFAVASLGSAPTQSWADGDPASDVLLAQDVFYPYEPKLPPALESALEKTLRVAASEAGLHLKVAIIARPQELGLVPKLFGHPQAYAQFLDSEISFNQPQQLLVVMPAGFGAMPASLAGGLAGVPIDNRRGSFGLTRSRGARTDAPGKVAVGGRALGGRAT